MRSAAIALAAILLLAMLAIAAATSVLTILPGGAGALVPTAQASAGIPPAYLARYQLAAQSCPGLPWTVLAAIGEVESDHGRSTAPGVHSGANSAGAAGPMQMGIGTGPAGDAFWRFAVDGNADGITSPYDPADSIPTAAAYLCQALADHDGDLAAAVFGYNHAGSYVPPTRPPASRCPAPPRPSTTPAPTFPPTPHWSPAIWCSSAPGRPTSPTSGSSSAPAGWLTHLTPPRWSAWSPTRGGRTWVPPDPPNHSEPGHRRLR